MLPERNRNLIIVIIAIAVILGLYMKTAHVHYW